MAPRTTFDQPGSGAAQVGVEQKIGGTFGLVMRSTPLQREPERGGEGGRGQVEGSQGIVSWSTAESEEILRDRSWVRSKNCDSRSSLSLSLAASRRFSSIR